MNTVQAKEWEKELKKITASIISPDGDGCTSSSIAGLQEYPKLVSFISSTLAEAHKIAYEEGARTQALLDAKTIAETRKERDDTAYAKGIIKGKEQAYREIKGIIEEEAKKLSKQVGAGKSWDIALIRVSDILSVLKEKGI